MCRGKKYEGATWRLIDALFRTRAYDPKRKARSGDEGLYVDLGTVEMPIVPDIGVMSNAMYGRPHKSGIRDLIIVDIGMPLLNGGSTQRDTD